MPPRRAPAAPVTRRRRQAPAEDLVESEDDEGETEGYEEETEEETVESTPSSSSCEEVAPAAAPPPPPRRLQAAAQPQPRGRGDGRGRGRGDAAAAEAPRAAGPPRTLLALMDLPHDILALVAANVPNPGRWALPLVCKAFWQALRPPCAAWDDLALSWSGVHALAAAAHWHGADDLEVAGASAIRALNALCTAAPRLHALDISVWTPQSARAVTRALSLLLGEGGGGGGGGGGGDGGRGGSGGGAPAQTPLAPLLSRVAIRTMPTNQSPEMIGALIDTGALNTLFHAAGAGRVTCLQFALIATPPEWFERVWPARYEAIAAAAPAAIPLRKLELEGVQGDMPAGRVGWRWSLRPLSLAVVGPLVPRMGATLEDLAFRGMGMWAMLRGAWHLTRLTRLAIEKDVGFRLDDGWYAAGNPSPLPALRELILPMMNPGHFGSYSWVATCRRLTAVTLYHGGRYAAARANALRRPPQGIMHAPALRRLHLEVEPGLPGPARLVGARICTARAFSTLTSLTYLALTMNNTKRCDFPSLPGGERGATLLLPRLEVLDLRRQLLAAPPLFHHHACRLLRVLRLGYPAWKEMPGLASATGADPREEDGPDAIAAAARRPFSLTALAKGRPGGGLPPTLAEIELVNVALTVDGTCVKPKVSKKGAGRSGRPAASPAAVAGAVALNFATKTAVGLRLLRLTNASTASPILEALLGDGGAVLVDAYASTRRRGVGIGGPPVRPRLAGDDLISEVVAVVEMGEEDEAGTGGGGPPPSTPPPACPPECIFQ
jgi:hypothetical protein